MPALSTFISDITRTDVNNILIRDLSLYIREEMETYLSNPRNPNAAVAILRDAHGLLTEATMGGWTRTGRVVVVWKENEQFQVGDQDLVPFKIESDLKGALDFALSDKPVWMTP